MPLARNGYIEIPLENGQSKKIRIIRAHLEEDAGKNIHAGSYSQVDLNRAGTPLLEIVTGPDMNSPAEVRALAMELQRIVRYLGVSEADMQKGHMRFEPNVNLTIDLGDKEVKTPIVEIKNLNSFRALERSIEYEIGRQLDEFTETGKVMEMGNKSTRGWDDVNQVTVLQREKEEAHDYRYFPEPDLLPLKLEPDWIAQMESELPELPGPKLQRFMEEYALSVDDALHLTSSLAMAVYYEECAKASGNPRASAHWIMGDLAYALKNADKDIENSPIPPGDLAALIRTIDAGEDVVVCHRRLDDPGGAGVDDRRRAAGLGDHRFSLEPTHDCLSVAVSRHRV